MVDDDLEQVHLIGAQSFNAPQEMMRRSGAPPPGEVWVACDGKEILASVRHIVASQFFGGRSVEMAAVCGVAVAPHARGRGLMQLVLGELWADLRRRRVPLSALFPTTLNAYRRAGYETAGVRARYSVPIQEAGPHAVGARPWSDADLPAVQACYRAFALTRNGQLNRNEFWWRRAMASDGQTDVYRYLVERQDSVVGYIVYTHEAIPGGLLPRFSLRCRDFVWEDAAAARSLLSIAAAHIHLGVDFSWIGGDRQTLSYLYDQPRVSADWSYLWMLGLVDPILALESRGYGDQVEAAIELEVSGQGLQDGNFLRLEVGGGSGHVTRIDRSAVSVDRGTLAAIYSGWLPAPEAARLGCLRGATKRDLDTLEYIFSGASPWMMDSF